MNGKNQIMNTDDFEERLRNQPLRPVPEKWREEILHAARMFGRPAAADSHADLRVGWAGYVRDLRSLICALFWPSPKAWAGLAATWLALFTVNHGIWISPERSTVVAGAHAPEARVIRREERQLLAELLASTPAAATADRPKPGAAKPRSELKSNLLNA
jgi:hypothetical protein